MPSLVGWAKRLIRKSCQIGWWARPKGVIMTSSIIAATTATHIEKYMGIVPDGFEVAYTIDPDVVRDSDGGYGECPVCGKLCHDGGFGSEWLRAINHINDSKKERRYHYACLLKDRPRAEVLKEIEGAETKVGKDIAVSFHFMPLEGYDNKELAAAFMTPNRLANEKGITETSGTWSRCDEGGYLSPKMRNLKWHGRLITAAKLCDSAIITADIFLDGIWVADFEFHWGNRDERGRWISKEDGHKHGFLVKQDWEVGKYRRHGLQYYYYPENIERAREERDYGKRGRKRFWL